MLILYNKTGMSVNKQRVVAGHKILSTSFCENCEKMHREDFAFSYICDLRIKTKNIQTDIIISSLAELGLKIFKRKPT